MLNGYDIVWGSLIGLAAPIWLSVPKWRSKVLKALRQRMGRERIDRNIVGPGVLIHAVSLGEINAARAMVTQLGALRPDLRFIITVTTDTGFARGQELYGHDDRVTLIRYPLDFSGPITRLLDALHPDVVVLMELEVWPNFVYQCRRRGVPVLLVNGRLTESSFGGYRWGGPIVWWMFRRIDLICAQDAAYARRFRALGAPADRVRVTGTMKFDTAQVADRVTGDADLAVAVGLNAPGQKVLVCGSTGPGEEAILLRAYRELRIDFPTLRLVIVPRHPQRFDEVAELIARQCFPLVRRSRPADPQPSDASQPPVVLGDTMGELRKFYSLADVVVVGRTLLDLGSRQRGSDMIEPAALGKPIVIGPWTQNFAEPMDRLRAAEAICVTPDDSQLRPVLARLLAHPAQAEAMGRRAQQVVRAEQGATARHVKLILDRLPPLTDSCF